MTTVSVGMTRFERATAWSQTRCATGLRYIPRSAEHKARTETGYKGTTFF